MKRNLSRFLTVCILLSGTILFRSEAAEAAYGDACQGALGVAGTCQISCSNPVSGATGCDVGETCCASASSATSGTDTAADDTAADTTSGGSDSSGSAFTCDDGYEKMAGVCVPESETVGGLSDREPGEVVVNVMNWLMAILGILAILMLVVAGMLYLTAAGDEKKTETAKNIIVYVVIGVAVALTAYTIVYTVDRLVSGGTESSSGTGTTTTSRAY